MISAIYTRYGSSEYISLEDIPMPVPDKDQVLVRVKAASINSWDWDLLQGKPFISRMAANKRSGYKLLGSDISGVVERVGKEVSVFRPGDEVLGDLSQCGFGGFAEYVAVPEHALVAKPTGISFEQAAALPQAGVLAWQALNDHYSLKAGNMVLIIGAGGGAGSFAIQLAKMQGAEVTAVDHTVKQEMMLALGADHVLDYTKTYFTRIPGQYHLIIDMVAMHSAGTYRKLLYSGGALVMVGGKLSTIFSNLLMGKATSKNKKKINIVAHRPNDQLDQLAELCAASKLIPCIDRIYPMEELAEAFDYFASGYVKGKLVVRIG